MTLARFKWPKAGQNTKLCCKECLQCKQNKISRYIKPKTCQIFEGITKFNHKHLDTVGIFSAVPSSPYRLLVTITDRITKWVEAQFLPSTKAGVFFDVFLNSWFSRLGVPVYITTDRDSHFESQFFEFSAKTIGFCWLTTTVYHPQ